MKALLSGLYARWRALPRGARVVLLVFVLLAVIGLARAVGLAHACTCAGGV